MGRQAYLDVIVTDVTVLNNQGRIVSQLRLKEIAAETEELERMFANELIGFQDFLKRMKALFTKEVLDCMFYVRSIEDLIQLIERLKSIYPPTPIVEQIQRQIEEVRTGLNKAGITADIVSSIIVSDKGLVILTIPIAPGDFESLNGDYGREKQAFRTEIKLQPHMRKIPVHQLILYYKTMHNIT